MDFLSNLGQNIKKLREDKNITQSQLAEMADVSVSTIARLELGDGFFTFKTIQKISNALNVNIENVFEFPCSLNNFNHNKFIQEISKYTKNFKSQKDYNFILDVVKSYFKTIN